MHFVEADHFAVVRDPAPFVRALIRAISDVTSRTRREIAAMPRAS
jgi:hypothetical protein